MEMPFSHFDLFVSSYTNHSCLANSRHEAQYLKIYFLPYDTLLHRVSQSVSLLVEVQKTLNSRKVL